MESAIDEETGLNLNSFNISIKHMLPIMENLKTIIKTIMEMEKVGSYVGIAAERQMDNKIAE
jgi:hypothetical protein